MAGIHGRTGFVEVDSGVICAYEWSYESNLTDAEGDRIETTTFCSSGREYLEEDAVAEIESSIEYSVYTPIAIATLGSEADVTVGNSTCTYEITGATCTGFSCTCPIEGPLESSVTWEKTESA